MIMEKPKHKPRCNGGKFSNSEKRLLLSNVIDKMGWSLDEIATMCNRTTKSIWSRYHSFFQSGHITTEHLAILGIRKYKARKKAEQA